uniref:NADH dehydrogenase subunit 4L n=1 Tax=Acrobeles complexus TaxID=293684 RepID=A0A0H3V314_9BILA|nr:NADH dehydrogenase subunit 4L [Acrobeles complexus]
MLIIFGILFVVFKGNRLIYVLIGFEMLLMSAIFAYSSILGGEGFILLLLFSVISSITGVLVLIKVVSFYGHDLTMS